MWLPSLPGLKLNRVSKRATCMGENPIIEEIWMGNIYFSMGIICRHFLIRTLFVGKISHIVKDCFPPLRWCYNGGDSVSNHQPHDCLLTVYSGADQSKHQSSASLAFVWGIHRGPVNPPHKWPVTRKMFPFDDVIMHWGGVGMGSGGNIPTAHPQNNSLLTNWGRDKMASIFQTTFSIAFSSMKIFKFRLRFHWSLFPRVQSTIFQHWFR